MENIREQRKGEVLVFSSAFLWSFFPIITVLSYAALPSLFSLAWGIVFAALFFAVFVTYRRKWGELRDPLLWKYCFYITLFIGVLYYGFYFAGLETTTPGNAAIIALFEVFTSFLFFHVFRKEEISLEHKLGAVLMVIGAIIVLGRDFSGINAGDLFILAATFCAPAGNFFQQKARKIASSETIMFLRSTLSVPVIFLLAYAFRAHASLADVRTALPFLLTNGILILGLSKLFWIDAIHRISVTKGVALASLAPFLTLLFAWLFLHQTPNIWQLASLVPLFAGVLLLTDNLTLKRHT